LPPELKAFMIHSMTGFGKAEGNVGDRKVTFQIRSLNSKNLDLNLRLPGIFRELEGEMRKLIGDQLHRGKVELNLNMEQQSSSNAPKINRELFKKYFEEMKSLSEELGAESEDLIATVSRFPEVFSAEEEDLSEDEKNACLSILNEAIEQLNEFRLTEGEQLMTDLRQQIDHIAIFLEEALKFEDARIETFRERVQQKLDEHLEPGNMDKDRFEQEMIYYMEKFDISEEKVRLRSHCQYFLEVLESEGQQGKKLNFIAQEIGREINTLGSKANHAEMQKQVVLMKESLEKIKEQILNVL
jgi:uncharacterized protein (TIGR00255 family)